MALQDYVRPDGIDPAHIIDTALDAVGAELQSVSEDGEHSVQCPAHPDQVASLRWRKTIDGRVLVHCNAGCTFSEILKALSLSAYQLQPLATQYYWDDADPEMWAHGPVAAHVRKYSAVPDRKSFSWRSRKLVSVDGGSPDELEWSDWANNIRGVRVSVLWRARELAEWQGSQIWYCEGEKDAYLTQRMLDLDGLGAGSPDAPDGGIFVTSGAGGAGQKPAAIAEALRSTLAGRPDALLTVVGDLDPAGMRRVELLTKELDGLIADGGRIRVVYPDRQLKVRDLGQLIDTYRETWREHLVQEAGSLDPYQVIRIESGDLYEADFGGGRALYQAPKGDSDPLLAMMVAPRVVGVEYDEKDIAIAWHLEWTGGDSGVIHQCRVDATDIESGRHWGGVVVRTGGDLLNLGSHSSLLLWMKWHGRSAERVVTYPLSGWNRAGGSGEDGDWLHVDYSHPVILPDGRSGHPVARPAQRDGENKQWFYGLKESGPAGSEMTGAEWAAKLAADMVWYRDPEEIVPLMAALAANAIRPIADEVCGVVRLMQIPGLSGNGKTTAIRPAVRLFGSTSFGMSGITRAGFSRLTGLGTGVLWVDDLNGEEAEQIAKLIRGGATGGGRIMANVDQGSHGTVSQQFETFVIWSAEAAVGMEEKAMVDRTLLLPFEKSVKGRSSRRIDPTTGKRYVDQKDLVDPETGLNVGGVREQWVDLIEVGANDPANHGKLTDYAGWVVQGLWEAAGDIDWDSQVGVQSGDRAVRTASWVTVGGLALGGWLRESGYPLEAALVESASRNWAQQQAQTAIEADASGTDTYAFRDLLPRALGPDGCVTTCIRQEGEASSAAVTRLHRGKDVFDIFRTDPWPIVRVLDRLGETVALLVNSNALYAWAAGDGGRRARVSDDLRNIGKKTVQEHLGALTEKRVVVKPGGRDGVSIAYTLIRPELIEKILRLE